MEKAKKCDEVNYKLLTNKDGKFATDGSEYGGASVPKGISGGLVKVTMPSVPATASVDTKGSTYARCRLSSDLIDASKANGSLTDGEVEDYKVMVAPLLATNEVSSESGISIYPNPVSDILYISNVKDKTAFKIFNVAGQLVKAGQVKDGHISVSELVKGNYIISLADSDAQVNLKFIKK